MELLAIGDKINIRRSDGCIQSARIGVKCVERQVVTVEWTQGSKVKGKEIPWRSVLELNPTLAKAKQKLPDKDPAKSEPKSRYLSNFDMYRAKANNNNNNNSNSNPCKKRIRVENRCSSPSPASRPLRIQKNPSANNNGSADLTVAAKATASASNMTRCSSVVREVERLKEQRERRRAIHAEQLREKSALRSKDPDNPNWEVALMVRTFRDQLPLNPLRCLSSRGAHVQQISVCVRKRPLSRRELAAKAVDIISVPTRNSLIVHELRNKVDLTKFLEHHKFRFDYTFDEECSNSLVYEHTARPLIRTMFEGGNATCFAYGQTGSGKTHTMGGEFCGKVQDCTTGIYGMAARDVFAELAKPRYRNMGATVICSYFEIYGSKVFDLLLPQKPMLRVLEDGRQQVVIVGLTKTPVSKVEDVLTLIERGNRERTSGQTSVNIKSSRSHAVFQIGLLLPDQWEPCGKCSFVDLAGNERGADTQSANLQTRREGAEINKSLLALKECIRALSRHSSHLPFRGSKLTQVLRDSFIGGEQNKTCMIAMISPGLSSVENTLNTLRYADRVKELVAKDDDIKDADFDQPNTDGEKASFHKEDPKPSLESSPNTDTESDEFEEELTRFIDFNSSQTSEANSSYRKTDKNLDLCAGDGDGDTDADADPAPDPVSDRRGTQITAVLLQHEVLFGFFNNYKLNFEGAVSESESGALGENSRVSKFLLDVEPTLSELEKLVQHTHSLVTRYNAKRHAKCDQGDDESQASENLED